MAAVVFPAAAYNHVNETITIPMAHAFNAPFGLIGAANVVAGTRDYSTVIADASFLALPPQSSECGGWGVY